MYKFIIKTFDQLKNDNFDQVKFDQVIIPHWELIAITNILCRAFKKGSGNRIKTLIRFANPDFKRFVRIGIANLETRFKL
jgi:hypothetical protein